MSEWIPVQLRHLVHERAAGYCEYCLLHEDDAALRHQPDHIIAKKHGGATTAENLALSCALIVPPAAARPAETGGLVCSNQG